MLQGLFSGEIVRDSLVFWLKISLKLAKWEEKSHTKQLFSQTILPVFPQKIHNFSLVLAWREIFYQGILELELLLQWLMIQEFNLSCLLLNHIYFNDLLDIFILLDSECNLLQQNFHSSTPKILYVSLMKDIR